jgi:hypothetical protein
MADHPINDYYVITSRRGQHPDRWSWEILRKSRPLGIKMTGDGFQSETAAQFAGNRRWRNFWPTYRKKKNAHASKTAQLAASFISSQLAISPIGTKRQFARCKAMSGVGGKADLSVERPDFSVCPISDIGHSDIGPFFC